jgi:hypothetical protein
MSNSSSAAPVIRVEFDRTSLEATLSMLVQMHFEMIGIAPAAVPYLKQ